MGGSDETDAHDISANAIELPAARDCRAQKHQVSRVSTCRTAQPNTFYLP